MYYIYWPVHCFVTRNIVLYSLLTVFEFFTIYSTVRWFAGASQEYYLLLAHAADIPVLVFSSVYAVFKQVVPIDCAVCCLLLNAVD